MSAAYSGMWMADAVAVLSEGADEIGKASHFCP